MKRLIRIGLAVCVVAYGLVVLFQLVTEPERKQWDFKTYVAAGKAATIGQSPYDLSDLSAVSGQPILHPYVYPPYTLFFFKAFSLWNEPVSYHLFLALNLIALLLLLGIWWKYFLPDSESAAEFLLLVAFGFREALIFSLYCGNIAILEELLIWTGLAFWVKKKTPFFCLFIFASAFFKGASLLLLLLAWMDGKKDRLWIFLTAAIFGGLNLVNYGLEPALYGQFLQNLIGLQESGAVNPSSFNLIRESVNGLSSFLHWNLSATILPAYLAWVFAVPFFTWRMIRRISFGQNRSGILVLGLLLYALLLPRFKDYSYVLLLIPALHTLRTAVTDWRLRIFGLGFLCITFFSYQQFLGALLLFVVYLHHLRKQQRVSTGSTFQDGQPSELPPETLKHP